MAPPWGWIQRRQQWKAGSRARIYQSLSRRFRPAETICSSSQCPTGNKRHGCIIVVCTFRWDLGWDLGWGLKRGFKWSFCWGWRLQRSQRVTGWVQQRRLQYWIGPTILRIENTQPSAKSSVRPKLTAEGSQALLCERVSGFPTGCRDLQLFFNIEILR